MNSLDEQIYRRALRLIERIGIEYALWRTRRPHLKRTRADRDLYMAVNIAAGILHPEIAEELVQGMEEYPPVLEEYPPVDDSDE